MTRTVCLDCGQPSTGTRCLGCSTKRGHRIDRRRGTATARGYDARWQRLSARARRLQPFCLDCGAVEDLTADHKQWPATKLAHIEVVCRACNSKRGATRGVNPRPRAPGPSPQPEFRSHTGDDAA